MQKCWKDDLVQKMVINGTYLAYRPAVSRLMQESVLGPDLFDIFITYLEEMTDSSGDVELRFFWESGLHLSSN